MENESSDVGSSEINCRSKFVYVSAYNWTLYHDVFHPPPLHLELSKPLWRDLQTIDVTSRSREDWQLATMVNSTLVIDPTIRHPGFDLHRFTAESFSDRPGPL